jgi:hypothetical protein
MLIQQWTVRAETDEQRDAPEGEGHLSGASNPQNGRITALFFRQMWDERIEPGATTEANRRVKTFIARQAQTGQLGEYQRHFVLRN